ncbi:MAG: hypothetical protein V3R68_04235 [Gammaproteobacteria bacterium]
MGQLSIAARSQASSQPIVLNGAFRTGERYWNRMGEGDIGVLERV